MGRDKRSKLGDVERTFISDLVNGNPIITLKKITEKINKRVLIAVSTSTIFRNLKNLHFSLKSLTIVPVNRNTDTTIEKRREYEKKFTRLSLIV